jgi:hypothetical protein
MNILAIYSSPDDHPRLRLDKEDRIMSSLAKQYQDSIVLDRLHASEIEDIHATLVTGCYDIVHFSGHGTSEGLILEKADYQNRSSELVSARRIVSLLSIPDHTPILAVFLCCFSNRYINTLVNAAPYVIATRGEVSDDICLTFVQGFYEKLFKGFSINSAFDSAQKYLSAKNLASSSICLYRRAFIRKRANVKCCV